MSFNKCCLCPRACEAERGNGGTGVCGMTDTMHIALAAPHMWEEPPISGTRGSGAIFFSGCPLGCVYCQNHEISANGAVGRAVAPSDLAEIIADLEAKGVHNIDFITGTHFVPGIVEALKLYRPGVPVVWNTGGYETPDTVDMLAPWVDIWLPDYKYALPEPAAKYSAAPDYPDVAMAAIKRMRVHQPENMYDNSGLLVCGVIVRHMVLPLNVRNSIAALERIADQLPGTPVSLMSQYTPVISDERFPELSRKITAREYDKVCDRMLELGIDGYMQERGSSTGDFIPEWDI